MIPLIGPSYSQEDRLAVQHAAVQLERGEEYVIALEKRLADMFGACGAVCTTSGTASLHLALMAHHWTDGGDLVLPTYTCVALLHACSLANMGTYFKDCEFKPESMEYNTTGCTHVIADTFGVVADPYCLTIRDCAQSLGATMPPQWEGTAVLSFHESKIVSGQHGGAVITTYPDLLACLRDLNGYADACVADRFNDKPTYVQRVNYRMSGLNAALVLSQLDRLPQFVARRREIAEFYNEELRFCPAILPTKLPEGSIFGRYVFALEAMHPTDALRRLSERGIEGGRGVAPCLHQYLGLPDSDFPNATKAYNTVLSLPVWPGLTDDEVSYIAQETKATLVK